MNESLVSKNTTKDTFAIQVVERAAIFYSIVGIIVALFFFWPSVSVIGGFAAGSTVAILNFRFLKNIIAKLLNEEDPQSRWGFLFIVKMTSLILVVGLLILLIKVSALAFVTGFGSIIFGIFFEGFRSMI